MVAAVSVATWMIAAIAVLIVFVIAYVWGTKREERSHSEEGANPVGGSKPDPPR
jgi:hypothetical protein